MGRVFVLEVGWNWKFRGFPLVLFVKAVTWAIKANITHQMMKKKLNLKILFFAVSIIVIYGIVVFAIPFGDSENFLVKNLALVGDTELNSDGNYEGPNPTIFNRRNTARYIKALNRGDFEKLQVRVTVFGLQKLPIEYSIVDSEIYKINATELCGLLADRGYLTKEYNDSIVELTKNGKGNEHYLHGDKAFHGAMSTLNSGMSKGEIKGVMPCYVSIVVKRKWHHYLLF